VVEEVVGSGFEVDDVKQPALCGTRQGDLQAELMLLVALAMQRRKAGPVV